MAPKANKGSRKLDEFFLKRTASTGSDTESFRKNENGGVRLDADGVNGDTCKEFHAESQRKLPVTETSDDLSDMTFSIFGVGAELNGLLLKTIDSDDLETLTDTLVQERKRIPQPAGSSSRKSNKKSKPNKDTNKETIDVFCVLERRILHYSCACDAVECSSLLLNGVDTIRPVPIDDLDDDGRTALHHAAYNHSLRCMALLLDKGASVMKKSKLGRTPLEEALYSPKLEIDVARTATAAFIVNAVRELDLAAVRALEPRSKDLLVPVAFTLAVEGRIVPLVALLLVTRGSVANVVTKGIEGLGEDGGTLVDYFLNRALSFSPEGGKYAGHVEGGGEAWPETVEGSEQDQEERSEAIRFLEAALQFSPRLSHHQHSSLPCPLIRAAKKCDAVIVGLLLEHGAQANETDAEGNTALHWVLRQPTAQSRSMAISRIVRRLLEAGANILIGNKQGATPVHTAAGHGHAEGLQLLLDKDSSGVNVLAATKETPLHYAVKNNHLGCTAILLRKGANKNVTNLRNARPGQLAVSEEMKALLNEESAALVAKPSFIQKTKPSYEDTKTQQKLLQTLGTSWQQSADSWESQLTQAAELTRIQGNSLAAFPTTKPALESAPDAAKSNPVYKTKLCNLYERRNFCPHGINCAFAHGVLELRTPTTFHPKVFPPSTASSLASSDGGDGFGPDDFCSRKVFVGGLPHFVTSEDMWEFFQGEFGKVVDSIVISQVNEDGVAHSRGFGFVTFEHQKSADLAVSRHYIPFKGRRVEVKRAVARQGFDEVKMMPAAKQQVIQPVKRFVSSGLVPPPALPVVDKTYEFAAGYEAGQADTLSLYNNGVQMPPPAAWTLSSQDVAPASNEHSFAGVSTSAGHTEQYSKGALHGYDQAASYSYTAPADYAGPPIVSQTSTTAEVQSDVAAADSEADELSVLLAMLNPGLKPPPPTNQMPALQSGPGHKILTMLLPGFGHTT